MSKPIIICVDDEPIVLESLKIELRRTLGNSCLIEVAEGGQDALELFEELQAAGAEVAVVICDYIMPDLRGDELLKQIHQRSPDTLNIMLTGQADADAVGRTIKYANLYRYIAKPWQSDDLRLTVTEALHSYQQGRQLAAQHLRLHQMNQELEQLNSSLEQKVAERTVALKRENEERRRAEQAANEANQAKTIFLANMSHELRTPLNIILGLSQLMGRSHNLDPEQHENLRLIRRSGEHLLTLINNVLDLSKIEAGKITLNETNCDLYRLLDDLNDFFTLKANDKALYLHVSRVENLPQYVRTDEVKLRQVLINLLNNALKFTQEGGVSVEARAAEQSIGEAGLPRALLHFEVEDTGPGIPLEELERIFEAFVQAQAGQQTPEGTGLGLSISRKFVELMGGSLFASSYPGQGAKFEFELPVIVVATDGPLLQKAEQRPAPGQSHQLRVAGNRQAAAPLKVSRPPLRSKELEAQISGLPLAWRAKLQQAITLLDQEMMLQLAAEIEAQHEPVAAAVTALVNNFEYEELLRIIHV
jgi:signal transduction histidine kinase